MKNLQTINLSTDGNALKAGGIAAVNQGTIDKCGSGLNVGTSPFIHGNEIEDTEEYNNRINAKSLAGGVAGENIGSIRNSHSNALVRTEEVQGQAGGITGKNTGSIENGYNTGRVDAPQGSPPREQTVRYGHVITMILPWNPSPDRRWTPSTRKAQR